MRIHNVVLDVGPWQNCRETLTGSPTMSDAYEPLPKKAANLSLAESLLAEAKALGLNVSQAAEAGLAKAVAEERAARWQRENAEAIASANAYVEEHGLPLAEFRMF